MTYTCYRTGEEIQEPVEEHAKYVMAEDTKEEQKVSVTEAVVHTENTQDAINKLQSNHYPNRDLETLENAVVSSTNLIDYLGTPPSDKANDPPQREQNAKDTAPNISDFDRVEIPTVAEAPSKTVKVEETVKTKTIQKTGLVKESEVKETDTIIW